MSKRLKWLPKKSSFTEDFHEQRISKTALARQTIIVNFGRWLKLPQFNRQCVGLLNVKTNISSAFSSQQISCKSSELIKFAVKKFLKKKSCRSESTLNWMARHTRIKLTHTTWGMWKARTLYNGSNRPPGTVLLQLANTRPLNYGWLQTSFDLKWMSQLPPYTTLAI